MGSFFDRLLARLIPADTRFPQDWQRDADWARYDQDPLRARTLLYVATAIILVLVVWSGFANLEEVTRGEGRVIPSGQVQIIQAFDGGVVSEIKVKEGAVVDPGDLLVRIDSTRFVASLRENRSQYLAVLARAERLKALSEQREFIPPKELTDEAPDLLTREQRLFESSRDELTAQLAIARQQLQQREEELNEAQANLDQLEQRLKLSEKELDFTRPLVDSGAVSEVEILRLERDVIYTRGQRDQVLSQIERIKSSRTEAERKIQEVQLNFENRIRRDLSETMATLSGLSEEKLGLADRVKHTEVRSPVHGTVKRLLVNTIGGVVQPGREVAEIVPLDETLVLEVRINPRDIAFLRPDQKAQVRFSAYDYAIYGSLEAKVEQIGADTIIDERGNAYYLIRVRTLVPNLGDDLPIIPGMLAQVDIVTGKKTMLAYLLKPILRAKYNSLKER
ncbi:MAG: HlyD family type I secretion periplasmic adaptor subunit [Proteobacteria bacterium]|nr:HlyD family type I secretion periplasmic adaptor subunit [Pseudomonadota bacterium]MBU1685904.1 HlyD family type I secretion periplasmic adaptor subunit [Pseudomonadota bacterium]